MEFTKTANWFVRDTNPTCKPYSSLRIWGSGDNFDVSSMSVEKAHKITKKHDGKEWVLVSERKGRDVPHFSKVRYWIVLVWESEGKKMEEHYFRFEECWLHEIEKCSFEKRQIY